MIELGAFLKAKRAALTPQDVGLLAGDRMRRVAGLRREEVAMLADVGVDHYTRLEQGRTTGVSEAVLAGIGRALRLTDAEQTYLRALAKPPARPRSQPGGLSKISAATGALLD
ncbi:XRE family transcriptional regulator, partial [Actinomadura darangshiensis]